MDIVKKKWKNSVVMFWERFCNKSRSSSSTTSPNGHHCVINVAPEGCFFVYVGPQRRRFVIKAEIANHPSFRLLLRDAELEYGFSNEGPLLLPCDVDLFSRVLAEIDNGDDREMTPVRSFACSPARRPTANKGYGSYKLLTPS